MNKLILIVVTIIIVSVRPDAYCQVDAEVNEKIDSLIKMSNDIWKDSGPFDENIRLLEEAVDIAQINKAWHNEVYTLLLLSITHTYDKNIDQSELIADSALKLAKEKFEFDYSFLPTVYINSARVKLDQRKYKESNLLAIEALDNCKNPRLIEVANLNNIIAEDLIFLGDYIKAKSVLELLLSKRSIDLTQINEYAWFEAYYLFSRVSAELKQDDKVIANLSSAEEVIELYEPLSLQNKQNEKLNLWTYGAGYFAEQNNLQQCQFYMSLIDNSGYDLSPHQRAEYLSALAKYKHINGFSSDSIELLINDANVLLNEKSLVINSHINKCQNLKFLGDVYRNDKLFSQAIVYYKAALDSLKVNWKIDPPAEIVDKEDVIKVMSELFETHYLNDDASKGRVVLEKLLAIIRYFIMENNNDSHIEFWAHENIEVLEKGLRFAYQYDDHELAFRIIEENKSNLLVKEMIAQKLRSSIGDENSFIQQEREIISEISRLKRVLINASNLEEKKSINDEIAILGLELTEIKDKLENSDHDYYNLKYNLDRLDLPAFQESLSRDECAVEFFIGEEDVYEIFVSSEDVKLIKAKDPKGLQSLMKEFVKRNTTNEDIYVIDSLSHELFRNLRLDEIASFAPQSTSIKFIPDDYLSNVSFVQLKNDKGRYLGDDYIIDYQYSAFLNNTLVGREVDDVKFNLLGYAYKNDSQIVSDDRSCTSTALSNLLCSEDELNAIQTILNNNNDNIIFSKQDFEDNCSDAKVIHLATHACVDSEDPDNSRLYFGQDFLTNYELKLLNLNADLVVLSACETGFGEVVQGEGSMSISKAFLQAGAKSALVSLWPVDDCSTSELMYLFYKELNEGLDKDEALRNAQLEYRTNAAPELATPYYWAGFIIVGDPSPIVSHSNALLKWSAMMLVLICLVMAIYIFLRKRNTIL